MFQLLPSVFSFTNYSLRSVSQGLHHTCLMFQGMITLEIEVLVRVHLFSVYSCLDRTIFIYYRQRIQKRQSSLHPILHSLNFHFFHHLCLSRPFDVFIHCVQVISEALSWSFLSTVYVSPTYLFHQRGGFSALARAICSKSPYTGYTQWGRRASPLLLHGLGGSTGPCVESMCNSSTSPTE